MVRTAALMLVTGLAACGGGGEPPDAGDEAPAADTLAAPSAGDAGAGTPEGDTAVDPGDPRMPDGDAAVEPGDPGTPAADSAVVRVWNILDEEPVAVERRVPEAGVEPALRALVRGPTAAERGAGHSSWFADSTAGVIRSVEQEDGFVVVDFDGGMPRLMSGAGTSFGSFMLMAVLDSTIFQFPGVDSAEYRLAGSCAEMGEWLQTGCEGMQRSRATTAR